MNLRPLAAALLGLLMVFGTAATPAFADDDELLATPCSRADFLQQASRIQHGRFDVPAEILQFAHQLCGSHPAAKLPALRHFDDTFTTRPGETCGVPNTYSNCVAYWVEAIQFFQVRPPDCLNHFKTNSRAGNHKVTCPEPQKPYSSDLARPSADSAAQTYRHDTGDDDSGWLGEGIVTILAILLVYGLYRFARGSTPYRPT